MDQLPSPPSLCSTHRTVSFDENLNIINKIDPIGKMKKVDNKSLEKYVRGNPVKKFHRSRSYGFLKNN